MVFHCRPWLLVTNSPGGHGERDMAQWLERGALPMSLPAVRFRIPLGAGFSEKYHVLPLQYWDIVSILCPWARHLTFKYFT